jgi:hypothetical protein
VEHARQVLGQLHEDEVMSEHTVRFKLQWTEEGQECATSSENLVYIFGRYLVLMTKQQVKHLRIVAYIRS